MPPFFFKNGHYFRILIALPLTKAWTSYLFNNTKIKKPVDITLREDTIFAASMKNVQFSLNKNLDKKIVAEFLDIQQGGIDFGEGIISLHPKLKSTRQLKAQKRKAFISSYVDSYYDDHQSSIKHNLRAIEVSWRQRERKFISTTTNIFQGFPFPSGQYIAFASIVDCNPRFLETKTFQIYYKKPTPEAVYTTAHELLHFIFFDFIEKKLAKEIKILSEAQIWDLSEIFNVIILTTTLYQDIIDQHLVIPYPNHNFLLPQFEKAYQNSEDITEFILSGINILTKKKS